MVNSESASTALLIYQAESGQWSGRMLSDGEEIGRVGGCGSPQEVEEAAADIDFYPDEVSVLDEDGKPVL